MNKNKGIIGLGLIVAIVLGIVVVGGGAYYLGKSDIKKEVISPENLLQNNENQNIKKIENNQKPAAENKQEIKKVGSTSSSTEAPLITSIFPSFGPVGTIIELKGNNLAGFEGDLDAIIKNDNGETAFLKGIGLVPREDKTIRVKIEDKVCKQNNSYSGEPCTSWMNLIPGTYKIYTEPWGKKSNEMIFTINSAPSKTISTTNWKTYTNKEYGFIFKYPSDWETPSGSFNGKVFEVYSKESIIVPFISYHPSNNKLTMNDFVGNSWGHNSTDVPTKISVAGQNASKFTYETTTNGRGQPYPLFNQQVGFSDNKGGFFVINFAVSPTEKESGINLFNQILSSFNLQ